MIAPDEVMQLPNVHTIVYLTVKCRRRRRCPQKMDEKNVSRRARATPDIAVTPMTRMEAITMTRALLSTHYFNVG